MAGRKLVRDLFLHRQSLVLRSQQQASGTNIRLLSANGYSGNRRFSVFNEFSKQVKEETNKNPHFKKTVKELKKQVEELKGVKEDLKVRTKQTTEQLYKQVDGAWTEAEATAKKVSANVKEKFSAATEEVKESFGIGKEQASGPSRASADHVADEKGGSKASSTEDKHQHSGASDTAETLFGKFRSKVSSSNVSSVLNRFKEAKFVDMAKRGYEIVKDELNGSQSRKKHLGFDPSSIPRVERSATSDIAIVPTKQSPWSKKWEAFKMKMQGNPLFKHISGISEPVKIKGEEIIDDMKERWENSDSPIVHKIQDINESIFQETNAAASIKEIHARDPSFSLPDFVEEVQNAVKPVLNAYMKGDIETLKKYCANEVIERCKAERQAYQSHDIFFDNKILHISDVQVVETKLIGESPVIIVRFQTQQIYCVRDKNGAITDGSQDTIQTVIYGWAMQPWDPEELPEGALFPIWRVREIQQFRMLSLI
ncbi:PREDICTED: mitochondrial import inner membrane translocase subunit TIM44-2 [Fragaria vesca subsp. vesca]|uniref:mitochondrial import inner membrane translocase subunit TIM44-2 n=1 Tax=Fragaria vesca subsp. vesca TaxID=101020 RepID=UPI0002C348E7|nr:PREDICTED: mitochondrial import inner membrane translocase subunit TIM44-2 [Fragaria vesca subsp. vesca]